MLKKQPEVEESIKMKKLKERMFMSQMNRNFDRIMIGDKVI